MKKENLKNLRFLSAGEYFQVKTEEEFEDIVDIQPG